MRFERFPVTLRGYGSESTSQVGKTEMQTGRGFPSNQDRDLSPLWKAEPQRPQVKRAGR